MKKDKPWQKQIKMLQFTYLFWKERCIWKTQKSEQKARRIIRLLLKKCPNALIVVTGCYAQLNSADINNIDNRIICVGGQIKSRIKQIPELLCQNIQNNWNVENLKNTILNSILTVPQEKKDFPEKSFELSTTSFIAHSRASLKIQDGCNNNCSYCAIHMARGHSVSLDVEEAIKRLKGIQCGVKGTSCPDQLARALEEIKK